MTVEVVPLLVPDLQIISLIEAMETKEDAHRAPYPTGDEASITEVTELLVPSLNLGLLACLPVLDHRRVALSQCLGNGQFGATWLGDMMTFDKSASMPMVFKV